MLAVDDPALPVELIVYIIELARNDRATIKAWSLVNHTCFSVTRYILFERLEIGFLPGKRELEVRGARRRVAHMEKYLTHVRVLRIFASWQRLGDSYSFVKFTTLKEVLSWFPNLNRLELYRVTLNEENLSPSEVFNILPSTFPQITSLRLMGVKFVIPDDPTWILFTYIFPMFPNIRTLQLWLVQEINYLVIPNKSVTLDVAQLTVPPLRTFSTTSIRIDMEPLTHYASLFSETLTTLDCTTKYTLLEKLREFLQLKHTPKMIKTLRFQINLAESMNGMDTKGDLRLVAVKTKLKEEALALWNSLELANFTALENIHVIIRERYFYTHVYLLLTLPKSIRTLTFELGWQEPGGPHACLDGLYNNDLEYIIEKYFPNLQTVTFAPCYIGQDFDEFACETIRVKFSGLNYRGMLRVAKACERREEFQYQPESPTDNVL